MSKVAIITDSNSGITQAQAKELGITVIPMPFLIDAEEYYEDINLKLPDFFGKLTGNSKVSTSQPSPETVMNAWDDALSTYDEVVYIPMSSGLSSSYRTSLMLSEDYEDRVEVVNNQRISVTQRQSVLDAIELVDQGLSAREIRIKLEEDKFNCSIYISLDTLEYLKRGGRLTPAAAMIGQLLKIKPVLQIQGEKLDSFAKVRTLSQAKHCMLTQIEKDITERFRHPATGKGMYVYIAHTNVPDEAEAFSQVVKEKFPEASFYIDSLSMSISCHTGPGALGLGCALKMF